MKKLYRLWALVLSCAFAFASCDDFLDMQPTSSGNADEAIRTVTDAQVVLNGVMNAMTSYAYYGRNMFLYADAKGGDLTITPPVEDRTTCIPSTIRPIPVHIPASGARFTIAFCK